MCEIKFRAWSKREGAMWEFTLAECPQFTAEELTSWELMQYTGLKDKNGKEIYEGDIVQFRYYNKLVKGEVRDMSAHGLLIGMHFYWQMRQKDTMEVISNIYENPELLEDKK